MGKQIKSISADLSKPVKKIVGVHLLNDFSGSPLVFRNVLNGFRENGFECDLHTCGGRDGFLSNLDIAYHYFEYRFFQNPILRLFALCWSQWLLFRNLLKYRDEAIVIYINTLLPFGAGLAGKYLNKPVVYHIHESSVKPKLLKWFLKKIAAWSSHQQIFVSQWLKETEQDSKVPASVVYNGLSDDFCRKADEEKKKEREKKAFTCLMLCSLKAYKGVDDFVLLAEALPDINFQLVVNASSSAIEDYFNNAAPSNLQIFSTVTNVHPFYVRADVVLNLSHPKGWIETFGMTVLEGMYYGKPCIVPKVGGPVELIQEGVNGYLCNHYDKASLVRLITKLHQDKVLYDSLSKAAYYSSLQFKGERAVNDIVHIVDGMFSSEEASFKCVEGDKIGA